MIHRFLKFVDHYYFIILIGCIAVSLFFQLFKYNEVPPCINDDEAAFAYNAYSLLKTSKDEHGRFLPLRLESYGDYKLPLYGYFAIPFIQVFGMNETGIRALNTVVLILLTIVFFYCAKVLMDKRIALLATFFLSLTPWLHILSRHAHEGVLCSLFILLSILCILKYQRKFSLFLFIIANISLLLATFSYHFGRIYLIFIVVWQLWIFISNTKKKFSPINIGKLFIITITTITPFIIDLIYGANRASFLFFMNNPGFRLRIEEYLRESTIRPLHNKLTEGIRELSYRYITQFSPQFFMHGDGNWRYTFEYLGLITLVEFLLVFIGVYFLFKNAHKYRIFLISTLLIAPLPNTVTFEPLSLVRNYMMLFPLITISAYGFINIVQAFDKIIVRYAIAAFLMGGYIFYLIFNWDMYFLHYPKRAAVVRKWQCGREEIASYVKGNYSKFNKFVITNRDGQSYMFLLFFLQYDPLKYQAQNVHYKSDSNHFMTVSHFDKFIFNTETKFNRLEKGNVYIGYPEDFIDIALPKNKIKRVKSHGEEIYWIVESI